MNELLDLLLCEKLFNLIWETICFEKLTILLLKLSFVKGKVLLDNCKHIIANNGTVNASVFFLQIG